MATMIYPAVTSSGVVTSFIPLTTVFTPSAGCSGRYRLDGPSLVAFDPGYGLDIDPDVRCAPSAVTTWWEQGRLGFDGAGHTAISLGPLTCPDDWITVASSVGEDRSSTLAMCCPFGYGLQDGEPGSVGGNCVSSVPPGAVLTFASTSTNTQQWTIVTTTLRSSSTVGAIAVVGWNIIDEASITRPPTTSSTSATTKGAGAAGTAAAGLSSSSINPTSEVLSQTNSAATAAGAAAQSSSSSSSSSGSLSSGAAAGLGVGVALGVLGIAALAAAVFLIRRKKKKQREDHHPQQPPVTTPGVVTMASPSTASQAGSYGGFHEYYRDAHKPELADSTASPAQELPGVHSYPPVELGG
ncbi:hypothetical protein GGR56DRAFT_695430 [Xylariaceae sp. FL0804]|nr:hypothetical protein GGR56DRAFT_695430 [Xylariaceae sp. FL0804]